MRSVRATIVKLQREHGGARCARPASRISAKAVMWLGILLATAIGASVGQALAFEVSPPPATRGVMPRYLPSIPPEDAQQARPISALPECQEIRLHPRRAGPLRANRHQGRKRSGESATRDHDRAKSGGGTAWSWLIGPRENTGPDSAFKVRAPAQCQPVVQLHQRHRAVVAHEGAPSRRRHRAHGRSVVQDNGRRGPR
jgi:hypothetical protein